MKTKIYSDQGIFFYNPADNNDETEITQVIASLDKLFEKEKDRLNFFVDMRSYKNSSIKARFLLAEFLKDKKEQIGKIAIATHGSKVSEIVVRTIFAMSGFNRASCFHGEVEALKWLKEG